MSFENCAILATLGILMFGLVIVASAMHRRDRVRRGEPGGFWTDFVAGIFEIFG